MHVKFKSIQHIRRTSKGHLGDLSSGAVSNTSPIQPQNPTANLHHHDERPRYERKGQDLIVLSPRKIIFSFPMKSNGWSYAH
ncbi:hypothetical protein L1887_33102 [Cichorium endivia]|nr:hypothetical protein L1887_33102 [Cichorium endivia]